MNLLIEQIPAKVKVAYSCSKLKLSELGIRIDKFGSSLWNGADNIEIETNRIASISIVM